MTSTVLAAIDLVHPDTHAAILSRAEANAAQDGARLVVVTVVPDFGMSIVGSFFDTKSEQEALKKAAQALHDAVAAVLGEARDRDLLHIVRHGSTYQEILTTAKEQGASLIVMGAHRPEFSDYLLGPNAARVARHAACSVFIVRD